MSRKEEFLHAGKPTVVDLNGLWQVAAHGLVTPSNRFGDVKLIADGSGRNLLLGHKKWGFFTIEEGDDCLVLNYDHPRNPWLLRNIRDYVRLVEPDRMIGRFYYGGIPFFWFSMIRLSQED
ncbi:MAG: hypothetical protein OEM02_09670 [Desulfobulbaceae bacterium]|nr:hypothetical protein [Desulfobulbaceae bacterium]